MKVKSEAKEIFIQFHAFAERQFNCKIKTLHIDWGGEFRSLLPLLNHLGICFHHPHPHTHEQNGKVERKHRHVVETGLTLLAQASLPLKYWWHAFSSAIFLINRLPTPVLSMPSPFELVYKRKPYYMQLKVFAVLVLLFSGPIISINCNIALLRVFSWGIVLLTRATYVFTPLAEFT